MVRTLPFLLRRSRAQVRMLLAVLAVVVVGTTLAGASTLLLTSGREQASAAALRDVPAEDRTAQVLLTDVDADPREAVGTATRVLTDALDPLPVTASTWTSSTMRELPADAGGERRLGYLAGISDLADHATLVSGRWPVAGADPVETAVPSSAAERLGIGPGDRLDLAPGPDPADARAQAAPVSVLVVGTFSPTGGDPAWDRDLLAGRGWTAQYVIGAFGRLSLPAYGPFAVAPEALLGGNLGIRRVEVIASPDVTGASPGTLDRVAARLAGAQREMETALGDRAESAPLDAPLVRTLDRIAGQQAVTRSGVLAVTLLGLALTAAALDLAGRLVAARREQERHLLTARGAARRQLVGQAAAEGTVLALLAAAVAVPLAVVGYRLLVGLPAPAAAGLDGPTAIRPAVVVAAAVTALALAAVWTVPVLRPARPGRRSRRGALARSGADVLLVGLAVVGYLQLGGGPLGAGADVAVVVVPLLCLAAGAALAQRALPVVASVAERRAARARGLVLPVAAWEVARRPAATGAAFLVVLATAAATFAVATSSTWQTSQAAQSLARVGADLAVPAAGQSPLAESAAVRAATGGRVTPVIRRPVALGSLVGTGTGGDATTTLLALDTRRSGDLLPGVRAGALAPDARRGGLHLPAGAGSVTVRGSTDAGALSARPTLVVEDPAGTRVPLTGDDVPLDGRDHPVALRDPAGAPVAAGVELTVVAVQLDVQLLDGTQAVSGVVAGVALTLRIGGADGAPGTWRAGTAGDDVLLSPTSDVAVSAGTATVDLAVDVPLEAVEYGPAPLLVTAYEAPGTLPVVLSADLAEAGGFRRGTQLSLAVGTASLTAVVAGVVPYVPSSPGGPALIADSDALSRMLLAAGQPQPLPERWFASAVADPTGAVARLAEAGLRGAVTRAGLTADLERGATRIAVPLALGLLPLAAAVLVLAGAALHAAATRETRAGYVARLQALGAPRRAVRAGLLLESSAVSALSVLLGVAVGALAAVLLAGWLTSSDTGAAPVPAPVVQWPWGAESLLAAGLFALGVAVAVPAAVRLPRRASAGLLSDGAR
ncbi:FtsX-like permease family protein [Petropleomorpha daqingensis]|uniref:ABC3 transporter permease C-terminal domain-containing protein n=1 Tax=Petropleomorpha daqingensis TaxID=2026353 RepID=A0A853CIN8_9ACTN|nr:ABC transporter permease [Petropleomorpha daqingensis]NYJ06422.1 hypothetical protein [Petropleomorpha daqingensis]